MPSIDRLNGYRIVQTWMVSTFFVAMDQTSEFFSIEMDEVTEFLNVRRILDSSRRQADRFAHELLWQQCQLVFVDMVITYVDNQLSCPVVGDVCHQMRKRCVLRYVKWRSHGLIRRTLVKYANEITRAAIKVVIAHELEERVARR